MATSRASEFFDSYARDFDAIYGNRNTLVNRTVNHWLRKSMRLRYEMTLAACSPIQGKSALDVGCGPGHYSVGLAERGARRVLGIDFAPGMIDLAAERASQAGMAERCEFRVGDFFEVPIEETFDFAVVMGFMDYVAEPKRLIDRVLSLTRERACFSFPVDGGLLGWQRKLRYRSRCELYMYDEDQVRALFADAPDSAVEVTKISRDFFVAVTPSK